MSQDPSAVERLVAVLKAAISKPRQRRLRAIIRFTPDAEQLSIEEDVIQSGSICHFRDRPLLTHAFKRNLVHGYASEELDLYPNGKHQIDIADAWRRFSDIGKNMPAHLLDEVGGAMIAADTLEFRFEIHPDVLVRRFNLPFELLCIESEEFLCKMRPMARRIITRHRNASSAETPHILFVDASATNAFRDVLIGHELVRPRFPQMTAAADVQMKTLTGLSLKDYAL